ncbi:histone-like nucleoid-structuring protein Lsr2 [Mycobacteroides saopaulense]|uniref:Nucleoid-associated protein Lsr2 n=1 Tax=Mycobacteroides saopaulense TaxID=1578165 RepID=A0ABX3C603_9MYCO|nr:Lsr2 family protein [Mycobacteroides saopaulense]OHT89145.1 nucleoid-associated protein Lsr2 [Mycobacteroides saopaulense]OHU13966.1 nucleoid-associated protein Lsr2 [Mycobacteroides saopaulense]
MAKLVTVTLIDDFDGVARADETVEFGLDGVSYRIDLSAENADRLRNELSVWIERAREMQPQTSRHAKASPRRRTSMERRRGRAIREWAQRNGHPVAAHGRISTEIVDAYQRDTAPA